ncbi:MAG: hypothetical protein Q4E05_02365 [Pseudoclavibacter sp.]|nr:hypothetical protein [Pseudoclavibacter sp.]
MSAVAGAAVGARPGATGLSVFSPYLGEGTVWQRDVRGSRMPLAAESARMAAWMGEHSPTPWYPPGSKKPFGPATALNRSVAGTHPIPVYIIDSADPGCPVAQMRVGAVHGGGAADLEIVSGALPWPEHCEPAGNQDRGLAIWDRRTGIMREWFFVERTGPRAWKAATGGYSIARPGLAGLAETNPGTQLLRGSNAVCCMHNPLGFIGADEIRRGRIAHALAFTSANFARGLAPSWPAKMSDGKAPSEQAPFSPVHGQWARVSAEVDPEHDPDTGRPYRPLTRLLIRAAQRYGLVGTDTNTWCHAFNAESGQEARALSGTDPWEDGGELARILDPQDPDRAFDVRDFPWHRTEWAPVDWGRPDPDLNIRPSEYWPHRG